MDCSWVLIITSVQGPSFNHLFLNSGLVHFVLEFKSGLTAEYAHVEYDGSCINHDDIS